MYHLLFLIIFLFVFSSCRQLSHQTDQVLSAAENNKEQLEQVLQHYDRQESEQLKNAVEYLIVNMYGQYAYDTLSLHIYRPILKELREQSIPATDLDIKWKHLKGRYPPHHHIYNHYYFDATKITAGFLIHDIDLAYETWKNNPYRDSISYENFCEYVLPYRKQRGLAIEDWRSIFSQKHKDYLASKYPSPMIPVLDSLLFYYRDYKHTSSLMPDYPYITIHDVLLSGRSLCEQRCWFNTMLFSALGIPATIDYVPAWGNRNNNHTWNTVQFGDTFYAMEPFWDHDRWKYRRLYNNINEDPWWGKFRLPKVFRYTYELNDEGPFFDREVKRDDIPLFFRNPNQKDVSNEYFTTHDVVIHIPEPSAPYYYLCVFNNGGWVPVQWGKRSREKVTFKNMGCGIVYLPAQFENGTVIPVGLPFILTYTGEKKYLPPKEPEETIAIRQTGPKSALDEANSKTMIGGKIQGANSPDFSDAVDLANVDQLIEISAEFPVWNTGKFRYIRFVFSCEETPNNRDPLNSMMLYGNIGEIVLYSNNKPIVAENVLCSESISVENAQKAFDGEPYTSVNPIVSETIDANLQVWIGVDLGKPVKPDKIELFSKNNDIYIYRGWTYHLYYWANDEWQLIASKKVRGNELVFNKVPQEALLLLKCMDKDLRERIFTYQDHKQVWW